MRLAIGRTLGLALMGVLASMPAKAEERFAQTLEAYLFVHFTGESETGEQIYFSVSTNGLNWYDLNNSAPVLYSNVGEKGVRDPAIIRSADGRHYYILATDLRIASGKGWGVACSKGSTSLVFWESADLVNWSEPWMVDVASQIPGAGCAWAPEGIYDETTDDYIVYWATISPKDGVREARIYYSNSKDFRKFTSPKLYIERVGEGNDSADIIDTQVVKVQEGPYKYYRASRDSQITIEGGNGILGEWTRIGDISHLGYTAREVEGPILFQFNNERKWCLLVDQYATGNGYLALVSSDLSDSSNFRVMEPEAYSLGDSRKRHGGILNITRAEYEALLARWPSSPTCRIESFADAGHYVRHANYVARLDQDVKPMQDARWRIVSGLASERGTVSVQSANFPDRFLVKKGSGFVLEPNDGSMSFAARASFKEVPGLANPSVVSFRLLGESDEYLMGQSFSLQAGPVDSEQDKRAATFRIVE